MTRDEQIRELLYEVRADIDIDGDHEISTCDGPGHLCPVCLIDQALALLKEQPCKTCGGSREVPKWDGKGKRKWRLGSKPCPDCGDKKE